MPQNMMKMLHHNNFLFFFSPFIDFFLKLLGSCLGLQKWNISNAITYTDQKNLIQEFKIMYKNINLSHKS